MNKEAMQQEDPNNKEELQEESMQVQQEAIQDESMNSMQVQQKAINKTSKNNELTHEENKLLLTLLGITLGSVIMWTLR